MGSLNWAKNKSREKINSEQWDTWAEKAHKRDLKMDDPRKWKMIFGSFKGKTLEQIFRSDPTYLEWMRDNLTGFVQEKAVAFLQDENDRILKRGRYRK